MPDKKSKPVKTNAMRILDNMKISYDVLTYEVDENDLSGIHVAAQISLPTAAVFKTIVLRGDKTGFVVACLPVDREIDRKALAAVSGNKSVEMLHVKDLPDVTGYIRGGCSPIGMKKKFPTYIDSSAFTHEKIALSAGIRGAQLYLTPADITAAAEALSADLV